MYLSACIWHLDVLYMIIHISCTHSYAASNTHRTHTKTMPTCSERQIYARKNIAVYIWYVFNCMYMASGCVVHDYTYFMYIHLHSFKYASDPYKNDTNVFRTTDIYKIRCLRMWLNVIYVCIQTNPCVCACGCAHLYSLKYSSDAYKNDGNVFRTTNT
jgi:hypothetical protein